MRKPRRKRRKLVFSPATHQYWLDGSELPSVTTVLKGVGILTGWYGSKRQMQIGRMTHLACHLLNRKNLKWKSVDESIIHYVRSYKAFLKDSGFKPVHSEEMLYSEMWWTAGTPDIVGWLGKKRLLLDIKTSDEAPGTRLQTVGYQILWEERHPGKKIHGRGAIILDHEGDPARLVLFDNDPAEIEDFKACRRAYGWKKRYRSGWLR